MNFLVYTRGNSGDFDSWQNLGAEGWNYEEVLPYFKKSENMTTVDNSGVIDSDFHGNRGLLKTSSVKGTPIHDVMVDSMNELGNVKCYLLSELHTYSFIKLLIFILYSWTRH